MSENGDTPLEPAVCGRCATVCALDDNFCRQCGLALQSQYLPAVQPASRLPVLARPAVPTVVIKGATIIAAGAITEMLVRRAVRGVFGGKPKDRRAPTRRGLARNGHAEELPEGTATVSEVLLMRSVRIRR